MRISVCEFLRLMTGQNWFYFEPGRWVSDRWKSEAVRDDHCPDTILVINPTSHAVVESYEYWAGNSSHDVRAANKKLIAKKRKEKKK